MIKTIITRSSDPEEKKEKKNFTNLKALYLWIKLQPTEVIIRIIDDIVHIEIYDTWREESRV